MYTMLRKRAAERETDTHRKKETERGRDILKQALYHPKSRLVEILVEKVSGCGG